MTPTNPYIPLTVRPQEASTAPQECIITFPSHHFFRTLADHVTKECISQLSVSGIIKQADLPEIRHELLTKTKSFIFGSLKEIFERKVVDRIKDTMNSIEERVNSIQPSPTAGGSYIEIFNEGLINDLKLGGRGGTNVLDCNEFILLFDQYLGTLTETVAPGKLKISSRTQACVALGDQVTAIPPSALYELIVTCIGIEALFSTQDIFKLMEDRKWIGQVYRTIE